MVLPVFTDEYKAYDHLEEHGFIHESVTIRRKNTKIGNGHPCQ